VTFIARPDKSKLSFWILIVLRGEVMRVWFIFVGIAVASCALQMQYIRADAQYVSQEQIE
jgi:hypothetical protein